MTQPHTSHSSVLQEARSVDTSTERLQELYQADPALGPVIASNPSAPIGLLDQLAFQCPSKVLANPLLSLLGLEKGRVYSEFSLPALVSLCMACDPKRNDDLPKEVKRRIVTELAKIEEREWVTLTCIWTYKHSFTLNPEDCNKLIDKPLVLTLEDRLFVDGDINITEAIPVLNNDDSTSTELQRSKLAEFLNSIANGNLSQYIESRVDDQGEREHKGSFDSLLKADSLPAEYRLDGNTLFKEGKAALSITSLWNEFDVFKVENDLLMVGVGEHEETDRVYEMNLGELGSLARLVLDDADVQHDWPSRLAALLIP